MPRAGKAVTAKKSSAGKAVPANKAVPAGKAVPTNKAVRANKAVPTNKARPATARSTPAKGSKSTKAAKPPATKRAKATDRGVKAPAPSTTRRAPTKAATTKAAPAKAVPAKVKVAAAAGTPAKVKPSAAKPAPVKAVAAAKAAPPPKPAVKVPAPRKPTAAMQKFFDKQREKLHEERATYTHQAESLRLEAEQLAEEMEPGDIQFDEESGEGATMNVERERDLTLSAQASAAVDEIDRSLAKIDAGTYGLCEQCGQPIVRARLEALPYAALCVACKSGGLSRR